MDDALNYVTEHCIKRRKSRDKTVHNLAFYLYAERKKPDELLEYLKQEEAKKSEDHAIFFEVDYALNVCKQKEKDLKKEIDDFKKSDGDKKEKLLRDNMKKMKKA
jgi:hypothetical protein